MPERNRRIYRALNEPLTNEHRRRLDDLLECREDSKKTHLQWLRQSPGRPNSRHILEHIGRLKYLQTVDLPDGIGRSLHQNRLLKLAREGGQMRAAELAKFEPQRRYATLVALVVDFDYLPRVVDSHALVRRYAPAFLAALDFSAAPAAQHVLDAIGALRVMYAGSSRLLLADAPTAFIKKR